MQYKELDLRKIREDHGLDFAHFTYLKNMCSCCSTPLEFPARYWHGGARPATMDNVQYLLFKNADNGSGRVTANEELKDCQCISWNFPKEKLVPICVDLQKQVGDEYEVLVPDGDWHCILIIEKTRQDALERELKSGYTRVSEYMYSPESFAKCVERIIQDCGEDYEAAHVKLDELLCRALEQNGYCKGVDLYRHATKW